MNIIFFQNKVAKMLLSHLFFALFNFILIFFSYYFLKPNDFSYLSTDVYGDVPILITRCVMISLDNIKYMNSRMTQFEYFFQDCKPKWNGEDIFMSIVIMDKNNII